MKSLNQLIEFLEPFACKVQLNAQFDSKLGTQRDTQRDMQLDTQLANLQLDSRQLQAGDVFIALQGLSRHGLDYLKPALEAKVACVLSDRALTQTEQACLNKQSPLPVVVTLDQLGKQLAVLADWFYDQPSHKLKVVGITGTNGKTSSAHYLVQLLLQLGEQPALIGTLGNGLVTALDKLTLETARNTTPDVVSVFRLLQQFYQQGATWVVMEVSSHALELGRIEKIVFEAVALTQVSRDHLDFHGTVEAYQQAKAKLFTDYKSRVQVINQDDAFGQGLMESGQLPNVFAYSLNSETFQSESLQPESMQPEHMQSMQSKQSAQLVCSSYSLNPEGIALELVYQNQTQQACLNLMGRFNIENVLCALGVVLASGFKWSDVTRLLPSLNAVSGRMQKVASDPAVIVDFAHTPDALQQVLQALTQHVDHSELADPADKQRTRSLGSPSKVSATGRVIVVFGCGGDRDQGKRPLMAGVAEACADHVVLTSDNPRFEPAQKIIAETLVGFKRPQAVEVIESRQQAIEFALQQANQNDVILIAGKGHENYQDIEGVKQPFSDQEVVLNWIGRNEK